jgi:cyclic dehypoxanthinyl futalosine synthase
MNIQKILEKALYRQELTAQEGEFLYKHAPLSLLMYVANTIRKTYRPTGIVTWIIDRNVNITNVCVSRCTFCNFHKLIHHDGTYITELEEYSQKIKELEAYGGNQLLIQGGMHPQLGIDFYVQLFSDLKQRHPNIKLHALGPPEIAYIAQKEHMTHKEVLEKLIESGMDSLPGAGAEILQDHIRKQLSPGKCNTQTWLDVMHQAHILGIVTSATMMYGHIETIADRMQHLVLLRELQNSKPIHSKGFTAFIPWPFYSKNTVLARQTRKEYAIQHLEYIRMIAISRIMLTNIDNIQASWLTVGIPTAQICLHAGAHDLGSIMIEENVVSQAGAMFTAKKEELQQAIIQAGFTPKLRNQGYDIIE